MFNIQSFTVHRNDQGDHLNRSRALRLPVLITIMMIGLACSIASAQTAYTDAAILKLLKDEPELTDLDLDEDVTDRGMLLLKKFPNLEDLELDVRISDRGLAQVGQLAKLRELSVHVPRPHRKTGKKATFTGRGFKAIGLAKLPELKRIYLYSKGIDDTWMPGLVGTKITWLVLFETSVTDAGIAKLAEMTTLRTVEIQDTPIGDEAVKVLSQNKDLYNLHLNGTNVTDAGVAHLDGLKRLYKVSLSRTKITDACAETLSKLPNLNTLFLKEVKITGKGLAVLSAAPKLRMLSVSSVGLTDEDAAAFAKFKTLHTLLADKNNFTDACLPYIDQMSELRTVHMRKTKITDQGLRKMKRRVRFYR